MSAPLPPSSSASSPPPPPPPKKSKASSAAPRPPRPIPLAAAPRHRTPPPRRTPPPPAHPRPTKTRKTAAVPVAPALAVPPPMPAPAPRPHHHDSERMSDTNSPPRSSSPPRLDLPARGQHPQPPPVLTPHDSHPNRRGSARDGPRRVWNRRALETSGISTELLSALDTFRRDVPAIPTQIDLSRKVPIRNMRKWISDLETPAHDSLWASLVDVLRRDSSMESAWGTHWDHTLCRFVLNDLVSAEDASKHRADKKQSRQAVNNAIKRELTCPIESGSSSRSKTFRDLFREKCTKGGVKLPDLESAAKGQKPSTAVSLAPATDHTPAVGLHMLTHAPPVLPTVQSPWYDPFSTAELPADPFVLFLQKKPSEREASLLVARCRDTCACSAEWGQTAWWELRSDTMVKTIPALLAVHSLFELRALLLDFRWMIRTFQCVDYLTGMRQLPTFGYDALLDRAHVDRSRLPAAEVEGFRLIRNALMLVAPILTKDSCGDQNTRPCLSHLATQLVGRLLNMKRRFPNIAVFIESIEAHAPRPWLRPLTTCFQEPNADVQIAIPSHGTDLIALSDDGKMLAVSGMTREGSPEEAMRRSMKEATSSTVVSSKSTKSATTRKIYAIRLWDVDSGKLLRSIQNIPSCVYGMSISRDQRCVIAYTNDSMFFWQLDRTEDELVVRGRVEATPKPKHTTSVTPTFKSSMVLTTTRSPDKPAITAWDTSTGLEIKSFTSVKSRANCVDVSMDGEYFVSGHNNGFVHLWHLDPFERGPVLSFRNRGTEPEDGEQDVTLEKVNGTPDAYNDHGIRTVSVSLFETGEKCLLATASAKDHIIRIWDLPPRGMTSKGRTFISTRRIAVLSCRLVRHVQWSQQGCFFSAGDDGVARMWCMNSSGRWKSQEVGREGAEQSERHVSRSLVSSGKKTQAVATYVTKSPYVAVWEMSEFDSTAEHNVAKERAKLYRPYFTMINGSVDSSDIRHPQEWVAPNTMVPSPSTSSTTTVSRRVALPRETSKTPHIGQVRHELELYFKRLDAKYQTRLAGEEGEVQPRIRLEQEHWVRDLEVCFEQPVRHGVSGDFRRPWDPPATQMRGRPVTAMPQPPVSSGTDPRAAEDQDENPPRRGMVAALQDGTITIFEIEDRIGPPLPEALDKAENREDVTATAHTGSIGASPPAANGQGVPEEGDRKNGAQPTGTVSAQTEVVVIDET